MAQDQIRTVRRPLLLGLCPGNGCTPDNHSPLFPHPVGSAGYRLYGMTGCSNRHEYLRLFLRMNLWPTPREKHPPADLRWAATSLRESGLLSGRVTLVFGKEASVALFGGAEAPAPFQTVEVAGHAVRDAGTVIALPHPSGRNPFYNDPENRARAEAVLHAVRDDARGAYAAGRLVL